MTKINEWEFFNPNPQNRETGDCVIRALSKATDRSWVSVYDELCNFGRDLGGLPNDDEVFEEFLEHNGFNIKSKILPTTSDWNLCIKLCTSFNLC